MCNKIFANFELAEEPEDGRKCEISEAIRVKLNK